MLMLMLMLKYSKVFLSDFVLYSKSLGGQFILHLRNIVKLLSALRETGCFADSLHLGFLSTRITLSPLRNILLTNRSLFTGFAPLLPLPDFGTCLKRSKVKKEYNEIVSTFGKITWR